jgi:hypothetical protein
MENKCKFNMSWAGDCKKDAIDGSYCNQHKDVKCKVCGKQATHECGETYFLVCGTPLCDSCSCPCTKKV